MKYRLLEFLADPETGEPFIVDAFTFRETDVKPVFDSVRCQAKCHWKNAPSSKVTKDTCVACHRNKIFGGCLHNPSNGVDYPIVAGVTRIFPKEILITLLRSRYPAFLPEYGSRFSLLSGIDYAVEDGKQAIVDAFGYQPTNFLDNYDDFRYIFSSFTRSFLDASDFADKRMLEIGCGSGMPAVAATGMGAEVVGIDIGGAVESAYEQNLQEPLLHAVQVDAYCPPVVDNFDAVYSVGVLPHITDPVRTLQGVSRRMRPGTPLLLWVYGKREWWYQPIEWSRKITRRIPLRMLRSIALLLALLSEVVFLSPYRVLSRVPVLRALAERIPGRIYARFPFRENYIGWFDRHVAHVAYYFSAEDIDFMLRKTGFNGVRMHARQDASASWAVHAVKGDAI